jgi:ABC-type multidrug transport system fused ATPase/permease subunit
MRVRADVTLGQPHSCDDAPVWEAIDAVGMREPIEGLPQGLDTIPAHDIFGRRETVPRPVPATGRSTALYGRPSLLILHEPTSRTNPHSEHGITDNMVGLTGVPRAVR